MATSTPKLQAIPVALVTFSRVSLMGAAQADQAAIARWEGFGGTASPLWPCPFSVSPLNFPPVLPTGTKTVNS